MVLGNDPADTKGRRALASLCERVSQGDVAGVIGAAQPQLSQWISGKRRPSAKYRNQLARKYGIPEEHWMTRSEYLGERAAG